MGVRALTSGIHWGGRCVQYDEGEPVNRCLWCHRGTHLVML